MIVWKALTRGEACGLHWEDNTQPDDMGLGQHAGSIKQKNKQPPPLDIFTRSRSKDANTLQGGHPQPFRALSNRSNDQQPAPSTRDPQRGQACKSREQQPHHHRGIPENKISKHLILV